MGLFGRGKKKRLKKKEEGSPILKSMTGQLGYPYHFLPESLSLDEVMDIYLEAAERGKKEGFIPIIMPEDDILDEYFGILRDQDGYEVKAALEKIGDEGRKLLEEGLKELVDPEDEELEAVDLEEIIGKMDGGDQIDGFYSLMDFDDRRKPAVLLEVPTKNPWETVVYVPFGGWNDCPASEEMATVCKYWYERYQAVPAVISHDTLEFILPDPISEKEAMEVAKEHVVFCADRVFQCTEEGTIGELADSLRKSRVWYFWWD